MNETSISHKRFTYPVELPFCPFSCKHRACRLAASWSLVCGCSPIWPRWMVNFLVAAHRLAWTLHPTIWLCESCAILWLVLRAVRSRWVRTGVILMLSGLMLNGVVTAANAGTMPVVGIPSTLHPVSPMWRAATTTTRLAFLADQARLGLFSIGDLAMIFGGVLIVAICVLRTLGMRSRGPLLRRSPEMVADLSR